MVKSIAEQLLDEIDAYLAETGMPPTRFGIESVNDGHLIRDLKDGVSIGAKKIDRVRQFMAASREGRPQRHVPLARAHSAAA